MNTGKNKGNPLLGLLIIVAIIVCALSTGTYMGL